MTGGVAWDGAHATVMAQGGATVVRKAARLTKDRAKRLLASGLQRLVVRHGKDEVALAAGCSPRCIEKALSHDTLPGLETALNALTLDPTVLDELLASLGFRLCPLHSQSADDLTLAAGVITAMGELVKARADGVRDHNETLSVATLLRPHLPAILSIVREADALRGAA